MRRVAAKLSTHVPRTVHSVSTRNEHQERTIKNVITAPATPSETATSNKQRSNMYVNSVR